MWLSILLLASLTARWSSAQEVETEYGTVRGQTIPVELSTGVFPVMSFWGIPFARPPVGDLRFEPPQKAKPWSGVFVADMLPNACMQNANALFFIDAPRQYSEDCLMLNVFAPVNTTVPLPVMVWIHGGSYTVGTSTQYPGHFLAARGVVVVTINYRLSVFGFASTPDGTIPGNMGMLDQVMALEFVRDNIAAFGGNPNSVTIFGESAGGHSVGLHLVSPRSKGLFHRAILESGSENAPGALNPPYRRSEEYLYQVAENANCPTVDIGEMLVCLRELTERQLTRADSVQCTPGYYCKEFAPVVDGPGGFMPDLPLKLREQLGADSVPILSGICKDDGSLFLLGVIPEAAIRGFTREEFENYLRTRFVDVYRPTLTDEQYEALYNAMDFQYSPDPYLDDLEANRQAFNQILTDSRYGSPWARTAKLNQQYADTFTYVNAYMSENSNVPEWMGVTHTTELPAVWGYPYLRTNPLVRNDSEIFTDSVDWTQDDVDYVDFVQTLWTNFAKYDNPTPAPVKAPLDNTMITWPKYRMDDNLKTMYFGRKISIVELYRQKEYAFFTSYLSAITERPIKN